MSSLDEAPATQAPPEPVGPPWYLSEDDEISWFDDDCWITPAPHLPLSTMSNTPPLPAPVDPQAAGLLSAADLHEIQYRSDSTNVGPLPSFAKMAALDRRDLLEHIAARETQVAAVLRGLLHDVGEEYPTDPGDETEVLQADMCRAHNSSIHRAARALGLTL